jgi:hypothetical protein
MSRATDKQLASVPATAARINQDTVCIDLQITSPGVRRKLDVKRLNVEADREMIHAGKDIIESAAMQPIWNRDGRMRDRLKSRAVPVSMLRPGLYLVPVQLIPQIEREMEQYQSEREELIDAFFARYPELIAAARERLEPQGLFDADDYPPAEQLRRAFAVRLRYLTFNVPAALEQVNRRLFERERERAEREWQEAVTEIREALRLGFADLVGKMVNRLGETKNGTRKALRDDALEEMNDFLAIFEARNLTNDAELSRLVTAARNVMNGLSVDALRGKNSAALRQDVRRDFEQLGAKLETLVKPAGRRVRFDDDDEQ